MLERFAGILEKWTGRPEDKSSSALPPADELGTVRSVRKLCVLDDGRRIFGADVHQYLLTRVSAHDLDAFEDRLGTCLPEPYRAFLGEVGYGAGPFYGTLSPADILRELDVFAVSRDAPSRPFPVGPGDGEWFFEFLGGGGPMPLPGWPVTGMIPVCHHGRMTWSVLVTNGVFTGTVWDVTVLEGDEAECRPAPRPPGLPEGSWTGNALPALRRPPTFEQWYRGWLIRAFCDFEWK